MHGTGVVSSFGKSMAFALVSAWTRFQTPLEVNHTVVVLNIRMGKGKVECMHACEESESVH